MLRLRVLGTTELFGLDGATHREFLVQPKRVALLVYLALARPYGFHRRDSLADLFWPHLGREAARRALRQGIYVVRHLVRPDLLVSRGDEEVALAPELLECDALEFDAAFDTGRLEVAASLYRGALLSGFYIPHVPDFEHWLEDERARLRRRATWAVGELVRRAETVADLQAAAAWSHRGLELAPDEDAFVQSLMRALNGSGWRAAALEAYDLYSRRLRTDFDLEVLPETLDLAAELRALRRRPE